MEALEKAEPATTLPVTLTLKDASGQPVKAEVSLALVDDAVLGLTGYKTPDLLNHFWGLKALDSQGYDLSIMFTARTIGMPNSASCVVR